MPVDIVDVMTLNNDRLFRPQSMPAEMYEDAVIRCSNTGCNLEFSIDEIKKHEFFDCPYQIIKCSANGCDYKNEPYQVHKHALQCPFLQFYCATCYGAYGAEVLEHSCAIKLKRRLLEFARSRLSGVPELQNHFNGDVILPPRDL